MENGTLDNYLNNAKKLSKATDRAVLVLEDNQGKYHIVFDDDFPGDTKWFLVAVYLGGKSQKLS